MIESTVWPRLGGDHQPAYHPELLLPSPASQTNQAISGSAGNNYSARNGACLPNPQVQNGFYGANMYAGQSDSTTTSSPDIFTYNPAMIGPTPALPTPRCINGMEPSTHYTAASPVYEMKNGHQDMWPVGYGQPSPYSHDGAFAPHFPFGRYCGIDFDESVRRKNATRESTNTLKSWLQEHKKNPYPTKGEKIMLAIITKMTLTQVSTWFANARRRLKKENKMTWIPKNRSSDANNNGESKKSNEDSDEDESDENNDDKKSLSNDKDGRITSTQSEEFSKETIVHDSAKSDTATKLLDKSSLKATENLPIGTDDELTLPCSAGDVPIRTCSLASPKRTTEKSRKVFDESIQLTNFCSAEKSQVSYEQPSYANSLNRSQHLIGTSNHFANNSGTEFGIRQSIQPSNVVSKIPQVSFNRPSLVRSRKLNRISNEYLDAPEPFYPNYSQNSTAETFLQSPTTPGMDSGTSSYLNFSTNVRRNVSPCSQNPKIMTTLCNTAQQASSLQHNSFSNSKYSFHNRSNFQSPNSFDHRAHVDSTYQEQQRYC